MGRRHPSRRTTGKHFAQVPVEVLTSEACRTLSNYAHRVLIALAAQFRGNNNGDLSLTWSMAPAFGINSKEQLNSSTKILIERGLITKTRQGGKKPLGPTLFAVTWHPINDLRGKIDSGPTTSASNAWAAWSSAPPAGQTKINQQHHRRGATAPPAGQTARKSAPPAGQMCPSNGTAGGAPSRSWPEGATLRALPGGKS